jgi:hypothetical protein
MRGYFRIHAGEVSSDGIHSFSSVHLTTLFGNVDYIASNERVTGE